MSNLDRYTRLVAIGDGNSPGKFYDLLTIDGCDYAVYGQLGTAGKAIEILDFDKQQHMKEAKGYWPDASKDDPQTSSRQVAAAFGLGTVSWSTQTTQQRVIKATLGKSKPAFQTPVQKPGLSIHVALATPVDFADIEIYIAADGWVMEQKLDGHRIRIVNESGQIRYLSRSGDDYTKGIPDRLRAIQVPEGWAVDGELVGDEFYAFDLLHEDILLSPLEERRSLLEVLGKSLGLTVIPQAVTTDEKRALVEFVDKNCLEGVVIKRVGSRYPKGRGNDWLKAKFTPTADVVVITVRDDGKESATLGITLGGKLWEIGRCSLIGKPEVHPGDVVEVKYLYVTDGSSPRLYQPTLMGVRNDKTPDECDGSDFRVVNKQVLMEVPA